MKHYTLVITPLRGYRCALLESFGLSAARIVAGQMVSRLRDPFCARVDIVDAGGQVVETIRATFNL